MGEERAREIRRAAGASSLILAAGICVISLRSWSEMPHPGIRVELAFLGAAAIPALLCLATLGAGRSWSDLERTWELLPSWQRTSTSAVALVCGLVAGLALVFVGVELLGNLQAEETEQPRAVLTAQPSSGPEPGF